MMKKILTAFITLSMLMGCGVTALVADTGFRDVAADAYYAEAVNYCREHGLMNGTSAGTFSPDIEITRAQLATILWRQAGSPAAGAPRFSDVPSAAYYANAAAWANENGIVTGYDDGRFGADDSVTRAQLATLLWRASGEPAAAVQTAFADQSAIPSYAVNAVAWAQSNGIVTGKSGNTFDPNGSATRAQTAAILYRYFTNGSPTDPPANSDDAGNKILVAYFSCTGTTKQIAEMAAEQTGANLYEITPQTPYTAADLNYSNPSSRATAEQNDPSARPAISGSVADMGKYDTVFIGYPIWHGQAPRIVCTFLESYDFSGKTVIPFCTSHSSGIGSSDTNLHDLCPDTVTWKPGERFAAGASKESVKEWIDSLDITTDSPVGAFNFASKSVLLNSGYEMPIMGLGTYSLSDEECATSIAALLEAGGRLIDTAYMYHNEAAVGKAIRESNVPREKIFVITKLYPNQFANAADAIDGALERMGLDYIDMMLLHHPGANDVQAYKAMEQAVRDGKVCSIGLSNWYVKELTEFLPQISITPALVQNEIHPYYQENNVIPYIQDLGIVVQGWYPFGGRGHTGELLGDETISAIAQTHGVSSAQVILRWNLQKGVVVIPGSSNPGHIKENLDLFGFALTQEEMARINALDRGEKHDWY